MRYNGETLDPATGGNALAYTLLRGMASELTYTPIREDPYHNRVYAVIR